MPHNSYDITIQQIIIKNIINKFYALSLKKRYCSIYVKKVLDLKMTIHAMFFLTTKQEFLRWNLQNIVFGSCYT